MRLLLEMLGGLVVASLLSIAFVALLVFLILTVPGFFAMFAALVVTLCASIMWAEYDERQIEREWRNDMRKGDD